VDEDEVDLNEQSDLLSLGHKFYFNHFQNRFTFNLIEHWRAAKQASREHAKQ
jgi:hypothetical protein